MSQTADITLRTMRIASSSLLGNLTCKVLATRKLKISTPMKQRNKNVPGVIKHFFNSDFLTK